VNDKELVLTKEGLQKLEEELDDLKTVHRREVNERIRQAKEFGDISENAEYEDAKQEQAFVEGRILKVEGDDSQRAHHRRVEYDRRSASRRDRARQRDKTGSHEFTIVGSTEADPVNQRLSNESPLGKALMGRKKGDSSTSIRRAAWRRTRSKRSARRRRRPRKRLRDGRRSRTSLRPGDEAELGRREAELRAKRGAPTSPRLRERGADPFAATRYDVTAHAAELAARYAGLAADGRRAARSGRVAGR
jgi:transcription elongation factor GreA